jgi:hypothetical protein
MTDENENTIECFREFHAKNLFRVVSDLLRNQNGPKCSFTLQVFKSAVKLAQNVTTVTVTTKVCAKANRYARSVNDIISRLLSDVIKCPTSAFCHNADNKKPAITSQQLTIRQKCLLTTIPRTHSRRTD